ncbi:hypothetical protein SAMN04488072_101233 [Lentibacillus halodurans]|uniref:Uncharacterized protein n=1 Tax=Lentibacillus halodurans TaxID=237679 RepID=A0A1I0V7F9_9BACI|nr:hypothetical protein SAMN04488072_101233 [Lentibacillus halodurans]
MNIDRPIVSVERIIARIIIYMMTFILRSRLDFLLEANFIPPSVLFLTCILPFLAELDKCD